MRLGLIKHLEGIYLTFVDKLAKEISEYVASLSPKFVKFPSVNNTKDLLQHRSSSSTVQKFFEDYFS